jgi:hypothetical protein
MPVVSGFQPRAGSDAFFLGYIRGKLSNYDCEDRENFLSAILEIFHWSRPRSADKCLRIPGKPAEAGEAGDQARGEVLHPLKKNKRHFFRIGRASGRIRIHGLPVNRRSKILDPPFSN